MKKFNFLLLIGALFLGGGLISTSEPIHLLEAPTQEKDFIVYEEKINNDFKPVGTVKETVIGDEVTATSGTYVQYGKTSNNTDFLRFATAVKGNISTLTYQVNYWGEDFEYSVTNVYRAISVEGQEVYYDGTSTTTSSTAKGKYYWACITFEFLSEKEINTAFTAKLEIVDKSQNVITSSAYTTTLGSLKYDSSQILTTTSGTIDTLDIGDKVWSDTNYTFISLPNALIGKPYVLWTMNGPNEAKAIRNGWLYVITGVSTNFNGVNGSQASWLDSHNYTLLDLPYWNLWSASIKDNWVYEKYVEIGETLELGRWSVVIMSDVQLDLYANEPIPGDEELAVLSPTGTDTVQTMDYGAKVFSDRTYTFYDMPYWLAGKNYLLTGYGPSSHSANVTKSGYVYMLTSKGGTISQTSNLVNTGWTNVTNLIPDNLNIFGDSTQGGVFLNSTHKGFALLRKQVSAGETLTWGKWGIPVFSGEIVLSNKLAVLEATGTSKAAEMTDNARLFSDRTYYPDYIPNALKGLTYFVDGISVGASAKVVEAGTAYVMVPTATIAYKDLETEVKNAGWTMVPSRQFRLADGLLFPSNLFQKEVVVGEEIHFGRYNLLFGAPLQNDDYYQMPSITTPADVIVNPVGEVYDIDNQVWLGCPTIEVTSQGRIWAGWFTGGTRELGTGNYAIIRYSDNDGATWNEQAVAVMHPDTAVQVTKPELWTDPSGNLWLFWIQHTGTGNFDGRMGTWASICQNPDAETPSWSEPKRLTDGYMRSKPIIINEDGGETWLYSAFDWMNPHYTCVYASKDAGETWSLRGRAESIDLSSGQNNLDDPVLIQRLDGSLWLIIRNDLASGPYESFSYDGGYTWTHARPSKISGPGTRLTMDRLENGKLLMVYHDASDRSRLTAFLSDDDGKTWGHKLLLDERSGVTYPDTEITPDGKIYVIYDNGRTTVKEMLMTVFTEEDILAGSYVSSESRQKVLIDKVGGPILGAQVDGLTKVDLKDVYATSSTNSGVGASGQAALDGDMNTRWCTSGPTVFPATLSVDLGGTKNIGSIQTIFEQTSEWVYKLYLSDDNVTWKEVASADGSTRAQTFTNDINLTAKYVKIEVIDAGTDSLGGKCWASIWEFEVLEKDTNTNLALNQPCNTSNVYSHGGTIMSALDGDLNTRYCASSVEMPQEIVINLGKEINLEAIYILFEQCSKFAYTIETSIDGVDYQTYATQSGSAISEMTHLKSQTAQYIKITITGSSNGAWASIWEIEVYSK